MFLFHRTGHADLSSIGHLWIWIADTREITRPLVVIEKCNAANLQWAMVRTISRADAPIVGHDIEAVFTVNGGVNGTDGLARGVFAVLTHDRLMHHLRVLRPLAFVLLERLFT